MKKVVLTIFVLMMAFTALHAQDAGQFTVGGRGGVVFGFHGMSDDLENFMTGTDESSKINPNVAAYFGYTFMDGLSVQAEANFMINQGMEFKGGGQKAELTYTSVDIPVLIKYSFLRDPVIVGVLAGPYVSIPLGDVELKLPGSGTNKDSGSIGFGATAGLFGAYPLGPGRIAADVRFLFDFTTLEASDTELISRRALAITLGYEFSF